MIQNLYKFKKLVTASEKARENYMSRPFSNSLKRCKLKSFSLSWLRQQLLSYEKKYLMKLLQYLPEVLRLW